MIFFRIDVGHNYGLGHYNRIKSLIKYLKIKNYKIIIDKIQNNLFLLKEKKNIISLYKKKKSFKNELEDANLFLKIIKNKNAVVIKDSYRLGYSWEKYIYKHCQKIISIDDLIEKKNYVDVYINHGPYFLNHNERLLKKIKLNNKKKCTFLLGPNYALFNSNYKKEKKIVSDFVFYNGASGNLLVYEKIIKKIASNKNKLFKVILIIGPYAKNYKIIYKKFKSFKNIKIFYQPENILNFLAGTKIFISSAGISMFESSYLKVPTLLFKMNENQNLSDIDYENLGHFFSLEKSDLKFSDKITNLVCLMLKNRDQIKKMMSKSIINTKNIKKNFQKYLKI